MADDLALEAALAAPPTYVDAEGRIFARKLGRAVEIGRMLSGVVEHTPHGMIYRPTDDPNQAGWDAYVPPPPPLSLDFDELEEILAEITAASLRPPGST